ncbi:hypothetical protein [Streptomyces tropicalis]|uniref:Lipoprotein n=1 Tax=Streptomyces tropicalis TaxID=3034234 RepID=A0ABT6A0B4_9ACTN|nr:hypothetical protein [Streptomyces tropicalis]MDF3297892.1 hypothetical protein [Streptomyces tropicalis]
MTHLGPRTLFAGCAAAASVLLLTSCTSGGGDSRAAHATTPPPAASASQAAAKAQEEKLTNQAQAALAAVQSGTMVEGGAERVTDGIHTEPTLSRGKTYRLNLVCAGSGSAQVTLTPVKAGPKTKVPCDQTVVQQRITARDHVRIDVDGAKGSTGVIAWQIDTI